MSDFFATEDDYATLVDKVGASKAAQIAKQQGWSIRPNEVKFTPMMGGGTEMAGNLGMDNQDDTTENDQADSEAVGALSSMGGLGSIDFSDPKQVSKAILANTAEQKRYYDNLANQIRDRRYGPSETEKLLALSAAFFAPTKVRGFSGAMGNVMPVLQKFGELRREGEDDRLKAEQDLAEKRMKMSQGNITNALALQRLMSTYAKAGEPQVVMGSDNRFKVKPGTGGMPKMPDMDSYGNYVITDARQLTYLPINSRVIEPGQDPTKPKYVPAQ